MKDFLFKHFEKGIFAALVGVAGWLAYSGLKMPNYLDKQQPEAMAQAATQVKSSIDEDHWQQILESDQERNLKEDIVAKTNQSIRPVSSQTYGMVHPWEGKSIDSSLKREDPKLLPPVELLVTGVVANLAVKTRDGEYALKELEDAEPIAKVAEPKKPERKKRGGRGMAAMGGSGGAMEAGMMDGAMDSGMMEGGMTGMEGSGDLAGLGMPGSGGMPGMGMPGMMGGTTAGRRIDAKKYDQGFRPTLATDSTLVPAMSHFIAGVALMPHKELFRAYEDTLKNRDGYNPQRDQPVYLGFQLQRADVTDKPVDQLTEQDWVLRLNSTYYRKLAQGAWPGYAKEIVSGKYRDYELSTPIPPVLLQHYAYFASHPKIPLGDEDPRAVMNTKKPGSDVPEGPILPEAKEDDNDVFGKAAPRGGMMGGMMGGMASDPGMMGMPGMMEPGMAGGSGMADPGMMMGGSGMGMGMDGMMGGYGMAGMSIENQPDYKLIRFYDFRDLSDRDPSAPKIGRKYVYRIRVAIEDPNYPRMEMLRPRNNMLTTEVFRRVEQEKAKPNGGSSFRWTEFSAPSPVVSLPPLTDAYAGPVVAATTRKMQVGGREIELSQKPPTGKIVGTRWDPTYQVPTPVVLDVTRGSVLAAKGEVDIPDPLTLAVKKLPEAEVNLESVVIDLGGGLPLQIGPVVDETKTKEKERDRQPSQVAAMQQQPQQEEEEPLTSPSWMLLFDSDGGLRVVDEVDSQKGYRLYSYADDKGE
jgi:hypothetical protein